MRRLSQIVSSPLRLGCSLVGLTFLLYFAFSLVHVFGSARAMNHKTICATNVKQLMAGLLQYSNDWDDHLPPAPQWATLSSVRGHQSSDATVWHCPETSSAYSYAFNSALGSLSYSKLEAPSETVCLFEADMTVWNAVGRVQQLAKDERHPWGLHYGFADGHVNHNRASRLSWLPVLLPVEKKP